VITKAETNITTVRHADFAGIPPQKARRIPELGGLHGIAIALVFWFHYFVLFVEVKPGSAAAFLQACGKLSVTGVDLFFVLSVFSSDAFCSMHAAPRTTSGFFLK